MTASSPTQRRRQMLVFGAPDLRQPEIEEVVATLRSGWVGTGPKVARFEDAFLSYKGGANAVALGSCTSGLHLSMLAAGLGEGAEVITTPMTFCATINAIIHAGATPVLADIDPLTMNIDPEQIERCLSPQTRAIMVVHFAGRPCEMEAITKIADRNDLILIEDCAHAVEGRYDGLEVGTIGRFGCFSFYVTKSIITGEGGMVLARHEEDAARIRTLALHGMSKDAWRRYSDQGFSHYFVVDAGYKCNMTDIQASLGLHQLKRVEENWQRRKTIAERYSDAFAGLPVELPHRADTRTRHAHHLYPILIDPNRASIDRDAFVDEMYRMNIGTGVHYVSIPEHPYYQKAFGWSVSDYPNAWRVGRQTVSLPLSSALTDEDVRDVIEATRSVLTR